MVLGLRIQLAMYIAGYVLLYIGAWVLNRMNRICGVGKSLTCTPGLLFGYGIKFDD